jgi:hypothetical protein
MVKLPFVDSEMICLEGSDLVQVWRENGNTVNDFESLLTKKVLILAYALVCMHYNYNQECIRESTQQHTHSTGL